MYPLYACFFALAKACNCKLRCGTNFDLDALNTICYSFWGLNKSAQDLLLFSLQCDSGLAGVNSHDVESNLVFRIGTQIDLMLLDFTLL